VKRFKLRPGEQDPLSMKFQAKSRDGLEECGFMACLIFNATDGIS
jgi:hypothetical protein